MMHSIIRSITPSKGDAADDTPLPPSPATAAATTDEDANKMNENSAHHETNDAPPLSYAAAVANPSTESTMTTAIETAMTQPPTSISYSNPSTITTPTLPTTPPPSTDDTASSTAASPAAKPTKPTSPAKSPKSNKKGTKKSTDAQKLHTKSWLDTKTLEKVQKVTDGSPKNLGVNESEWMQGFDICSAGFQCCFR
jgi:hypothetical protein